MKKIFKVGLMLVFASGALFALSADECIINEYRGTDLITPICSTRTLMVMDVYGIGGTTNTSMTMEVGVSSFTFKCTDGLYAGTTYYVFVTTTNTSTLDEFKTWADGVPATTLGLEGGLSVTLLDGVYGGNDISSMTISTVDHNIFGSTHTVRLATDAITGFEYTIDATEYKITFLTAVSVIATFGSGVTSISIYDGTDATGGLLFQRTLVTSTWIDGIAGDPGSYVPSSRGSAIFVQVLNDSNIALTANKLNLRGLVR